VGAPGSIVCPKWGAYNLQPRMQAVPSVLNYFRRWLGVRQISGDLIEVERILATARAVLAVGSLAAVYFDPTEPSRYAGLAHDLLLTYTGYSLALVGILRFGTTASPRLSFAVHATDVLWPTIISLFTDGPNSPFFLYFIFALLAAAFRWGMRGALFTTLIATGIVITEAVALTNGPLSHLLGPQSDVNGFVTRVVYLVIFGFLIGYMAELEKQQRAEALRIFRLSAKARVDAGLKGSLQAIFAELLNLFDGRELLLVTSEAETQRAYLWRAGLLSKTDEAFVTQRELETSEKQRYLFVMPGTCAGAAWRGRNARSTLMIDNGGARISGAQCYLPTEFVAQHPFGRLLLSTVSVAPDVSARLFLFESKIGGRSEKQLRFLRNLVNQVAPAIYNVYLLRRLRSRATAVERTRVARDLHDGVVQSLHAIGFRLYALRTQATIDARERDQELLAIQELVQTEAMNIRTLIQHLKPLDFDPRHLVEFLAAMIDRYRYDTGIAAKFVCDASDLMMPPAISRDVARIVQEALVNVQKHSMAQNVLVRFGSYNGGWILTIEDDGRGFEFYGRFSHSELEDSRRGPLIIKERVRAIGGELSIDTGPGRGARLEIKIPRQEQATIA
jgi:signal transduction histidine kinase